MSAPVAAACRASSTVSRTFVLAGQASTSAPGLMLRTSSTATSNSRFRSVVDSAQHSPTSPPTQIPSWSRAPMQWATSARSAGSSISSPPAPLNGV